MNLVKWMQRAGSNPWPGITIDQLPYWFGQFGYQGLGYGPAMIQTIQQNRETIAADFTGFINGAYKTNGAIFACVMTRLMLFSEARIQFRRMNMGRPGKLFGTNALDIVEHPWQNATTGDLLTKAIVDADLAGNFYATRLPRLDGRGSKIARMRPDWVTIILGSNDDPSLDAFDPGAELVGYIYQPGGHNSGKKPHFYLPHEVMHWAPIPDPLAHYRGMSWIQPVLSEVLADRAMITHKHMYFEQGACLVGSAKVATPTGWTRIDQVQEGDRVIGADGQPTEVLGVYRPGEKDVYRATFTGGVSVDCCGDHLWQVQTAYDREGRPGRSGEQREPTFQVRSTRSLLEEGVRYSSGPHKFTIPLTAPVEYDDPGPLPLDPYLLGSLLGDGHACRYVELAMHASDAPWMERECQRLLPADAPLTISQECRAGTNSARLRFSRQPGSPRENWLMGRLRDLCVADVVHHEKFVPELYMRASVGDRESLLQGLIDTDGHVSEGQSGAIRFSSTSERLARQVVELVEGLGGVASIKRRVRNAPNAQVQWAVYFSRLPEEIVPVRLPRKREQYRLSRRFVDRTRFLKSIEPIGREEVFCIKVAAPDGLYLTDDFIVTHNTPNLVVSMETGKMDRRTFQEWVDTMESEHGGAMNAWKTLYLGNGASATVVGSNLKDLDYAIVQGHGEPLALDTPVPTPTGWTTMADIRAGDEVFGREGRPIKVLKVLPVHEGRPCYRVSFSDGTSIVSDASHVWTAIDRKTTRSEREFTTAELFELHSQREGNRFGIPAGKLPEVDLLIDRDGRPCRLATEDVAIVAIEPVESVPVRCIAVDSPDHLFRAGEGWTLTHNTRISAAAGVPAIIVGFSEGLESATYSNFGQARRAFGDKTLRPLWRNFCGSLETLVPPPPGSQVWYDDRDISFLQEDMADEANIQLTRATAIKLLVDAGYEPDSVTDAVNQNDITLLRHSGLYSVQLQPPGSGPPPNAGELTGSPTGPGLPDANGNGDKPDGKGNGKGNGKSVMTPSKRDELLGSVNNVTELAHRLIEVQTSS